MLIAIFRCFSSLIIILGSAMFDTVQQLSDKEVLDNAVAKWLDEQDVLAKYKQEFAIPTRRDVIGSYPPIIENNSDLDQPCTYLCGNSLGLMPKQTVTYINEELEAWSKRGVEGHWNHPYNRPWVSVDQQVKGCLANLVGAKPVEVSAMNSLTVNLHVMMTTFYQPTKERFKILIESKAFPSDHYAVSSHIATRGIDPAVALLTIAPRDGEATLRTEDILKIIDDNKDIALVLLSGVQYYTGQLFEIPIITKYAKEKGCIVGWDLAHAIGNVVLELHEWEVDFACWCTYKYLNAGPGGIAGLFIHEKYAKDTSLQRLAGWWGNQKENRFEMLPEFRASEGASGYQQSNPNVFATISLMSSLQLFDNVGMEALRNKALGLTRYLERLFYLVLDDHCKAKRFCIITPSDPQQRGCQLSIEFPDKMMDIFDALHYGYGVLCDERKPTVIRLAPAPLYNSYSDVYHAVFCLKKVMDKVF